MQRDLENNFYKAHGYHVTDPPSSYPFPVLLESMYTEIYPLLFIEWTFFITSTSVDLSNIKFYSNIGIGELILKGFLPIRAFL